MRADQHRDPRRRPVERPHTAARVLDPAHHLIAAPRRPAGTGTLQFNLMLSLDPLTLGSDGYREIFQADETLKAGTSAPAAT